VPGGFTFPSKHRATGIDADDDKEKASNWSRNFIHRNRDYRYFYPDSTYNPLSGTRRYLLYAELRTVLSMAHKQQNIWSLRQELHRRQRNAHKNKGIYHPSTLANYRTQYNFWSTEHSCKDSTNLYCCRSYSTYLPDQKKKS